MGMYDSIKCEYTIYEGQDVLFQTKNLDCLLEEYLITDEGELFKMSAMTGKSSWEAHRLKPPEKINYTGEISFYDLDDKYKNNWLEYSAYFKDGELQQINRIE